MRESDFKKFGNQPPLRQESWIEIEGFKGIAHATQGAYLFDHELGQCWIPKRAVKFERKITASAGEAEYRVLVASWFNWAEKLRLMREGRLIGDDVLKARNEAEDFFKIGAEVRISVMPKKKTLKGTKPKPEDLTWDELFGRPKPKVPTESDYVNRNKQLPPLASGNGSVDFKEMLRRKREVAPDINKAPRPFLDREGNTEEIARKQEIRDKWRNRKAQKAIDQAEEKETIDKLKIDLRTLREDLRYYLENDAENLIDSTRKKILALVLQKEELGMMKTGADKRFIRKLREEGVFYKWSEQIESGEKEKPQPEPKGRAIDL